MYVILKGLTFDLLVSHIVCYSPHKLHNGSESPRRLMPAAATVGCTSTMTSMNRFSVDHKGWGKSKPKGQIIGPVITDWKTVISHSYEPVMFSAVFHRNTGVNYISNWPEHCMNSGPHAVLSRPHGYTPVLKSSYPLISRNFRATPFIFWFEDAFCSCLGPLKTPTIN